MTKQSQMTEIQMTKRGEAFRLRIEFGLMVLVIEHLEIRSLIRHYSFVIRHFAVVLP